MKHFVLIFWGTIDGKGINPEIFGPYKTPEERDKEAKELRVGDEGEDGGIYAIDIKKGIPVVEGYPPDFFNAEE